MRFAGETILVTGSSRGIGRAVAVMFAREGGTVVVHGSRESAELSGAFDAVSAVSPESIKLVCDLSDTAAIHGMFKAIKSRIGRLDILVNNAAALRHAAFLDMSVEDWDHVFAVNLRAPFLCGQLAARMMIDSGGGSIVNVGSVHEYQVKRNDANYSSAKGGLLMLTKNMALELADHNIRVNHVTPGAIATDLTDPERQAKFLSAVPAARMGQADEIASIVCYLAGSDAGYITGSSIVADGGLTLGFCATRRDL